MAFHSAPIPASDPNHKPFVVDTNRILAPSASALFRGCAKNVPFLKNSIPCFVMNQHHAKILEDIEICNLVHICFKAKI